ncbi:hypothetical protein [Micromonospora rubida]|uniref:hypothetical protein n=1 Tax=Micromonospora rubida TaxID=2697657 RepID=UPI00191BE294|nr:hypothetical protein [Micromonospora rubida]
MIRRQVEEGYRVDLRVHVLRGGGLGTLDELRDFLAGYHERDAARWRPTEFREGDVTGLIGDGEAFRLVEPGVAIVDDPAERALLHRLLGRSACAVLSTWGEDWQELAYWRRFTGRADLAAVVMAVLEHDACVLTSEVKVYGDGADLPVIGFPS